MRLRYVSMGKVTTRVWLFILLASMAVPVMHIMFPYINTSQYYYVEQMLSNVAQHQNQTAAEAAGLGKALAGESSYIDKFKAFLTLTPVGFGIRAFLMVFEGIMTGLHPVWMMLGFDAIKTESGISLADILTSMVYMFYAWTIIDMITGRDD